MKLFFFSIFLFLSCVFSYAEPPINSNKQFLDNLNKLMVSINTFDENKSNFDIKTEFNEFTELAKEGKLTTHASIINHFGFFNGAAKKKISLLFDNLLQNTAFVNITDKSEFLSVFNKEIGLFGASNDVDSSLTQNESNQLKMMQITLQRSIEPIYNYIIKHNKHKKGFVDIVCSLAGQITIVALCTAGFFLGSAILCGINCGYLGGVIGFVGATYIIRPCKQNNGRGRLGQF